jgi:hypothetical protein
VRDLLLFSLNSRYLDGESPWIAGGGKLNGDQRIWRLQNWTVPEVDYERRPNEIVPEDEHVHMLDAADRSPPDKATKTTDFLHFFRNVTGVPGGGAVCPRTTKLKCQPQKHMLHLHTIERFWEPEREKHAYHPYLTRKKCFPKSLGMSSADPTASADPTDKLAGKIPWDILPARISATARRGVRGDKELLNYTAPSGEVLMRTPVNWAEENCGGYQLCARMNYDGTSEIEPKEE